MPRRIALTAALLALLCAPAAGAKLAVSVERERFVPAVAVAAAAPEPTGSRGRLYVVRGRSPRTGPGPVRRYVVEVEGGLLLDRRAFAERVHSILGDPRGWGGTGRVSFRRVSSGLADFRVALASPPLADRLCAPYATNGIYSCANGGRAVLNLTRWREGAAAFGPELGRYRAYLVEHEVGHLLGRGHVGCPAAGARAPVMMQQTKGVGACRANPWPLAWERG